MSGTQLVYPFFLLKANFFGFKGSAAATIFALPAGAGPGPPRDDICDGIVCTAAPPDASLNAGFEVQSNGKPG